MNKQGIKIGIIADAQYADRPHDPEANRYYSHSLERLAEAVVTFDNHEVDLVINLGDLIEEGWRNLGPALEILEKARAPVFHVPGNHDFAVEQNRIDDVRARLARDHGEYPHRHQITDGLRLLLLDASAMSLFGTTDGTPPHLEASGWFTEMNSAGKPNAKSYNGGLGNHQRHWLRHELKDAHGLGEQVIIACHQPIHEDNSKYHLWDAEQTAEIISQPEGTVLAWLSGHSHKPLHAVKDGILHWHAAAMVDSPDQNAYAIMHVTADNIRVEGFGRQPSLPRD